MTDGSKVLLDMREVGFLSSAGLRVLLVGYRQPLCDGLVNLLAAYHATAPQSDDITVVVVKVR